MEKFGMRREAGMWKRNRRDEGKGRKRKNMPSVEKEIVLVAAHQSHFRLTISRYL
jgi:hypothetical protein